MKQIKGLLGVLLLGSLFTGCSSESEFEANEASLRVPILLDSRVGEMTRSSSHDQDVQLVKGQNVSFFVRDADQWEMLYEDVKLTADGSGHFSQNGLYYPMQNDELEFIGIHPYDPVLDSHADSYQFSIQEDQSSYTNYLNSDLLYTKKEHIVKTNKAVSLTFDHKLSKIDFTIKKENGVDLSKLSSIEVMGIKSQITMGMGNGVVYGSNNEVAGIKAYGVKGIQESETELSDISVIIPPQDLYTGAKFIKLVIDNKEYYYTLDKDMGFESGKKYNFTLTVSGIGIDLDTNISDWIPGGNDANGNIII